MKYKNRVELHCHSKYGGNAMMHAGEIIMAADKISLSAIAITDTSSIMAFPEVESVCRHGKYATRPVYGMEVIVEDNTLHKHRITVLIKGEEGKNAVYKIISGIDIKENIPVFSEADFLNARNGLLIGSGTCESELYEKVFAKASDNVLRAIIEKYDYVELLPGKLYKEANARLVNICEEMKKPAVAVGDVHYLDNDGAAAWKVFCNWNKSYSEGDYHLYSTEEMLAAFDYLGEDMAYEVVVNNSNLIAEKCSTISIVPSERQYPEDQGAGERLAERCRAMLADKYDVTCQQSERLDDEIEALSNNNIEFIPLLVSNVLSKAKLKACDISLRGTGAGSMIIYLLGISEVDPIKHNLPPEFIYGYERMRELDLDINIPIEKQSKVFELFGDEAGIEKCVRLGTYHVISDNLARAMIEQYEQDYEISFPEEKCEKICWKLVGNYVGRGKHPGGILLLAEGRDNNMPFLKTADGIENTYYEYHFLDSSYLKLDLLPNDTVNRLSEMAHAAGIDLEDVPYDDKEVLNLFKPDCNGDYSGCADLPEFSSVYVQNMLKILKPETFDDLVRISLLSHGTDCWSGNGEKLVAEGITDIHGIIAGREDIFEYLCAHGIDRKLAYDVADSVRKGIIRRGRRVNWNEWKVELRSHGIPEWYLASCEKIGYLFPRAHAISYLYMTMRMGWFKVNYPEVFNKIKIEHETRLQ